MNTDNSHQTTSAWIQLLQNSLAPVVLIILAIFSYLYGAEEDDRISAPCLELAEGVSQEVR